MKIALVYDRVNKIGGAERVLETLHEIWPEAPLFTAVYNPSSAPWADKFQIVSSFINKLPYAKKHHELYPWLTPIAFEAFDFSPYDLVISVTSAEAKGIITKPKTLHLCFCLTPTRYLWSDYENYFSSKAFRFISAPVVNYLRKWDKIAAQRPDFYIAISENVRKRIKKYYGRDPEMIYPPVDTEKFVIRPPFREVDNSKFVNGEYFLVVSRLVAYKKVDLAIEAFNALGWNLKIIGTGNQMIKLKRISKKNIFFLGQLTDEELLGYYQKCQAVIFPTEEDFGLVPLEAQACGKPVIAYKGGGALETIIEGKTGDFFYPQTVEALIKKLKSFKVEKYPIEDCRKNAERFSKQIFKQKIKNFVEKNGKVS